MYTTFRRLTRARVKTKGPRIPRIIQDQSIEIYSSGYQSRLTGEYLLNAYYSGHLYQPLLVHPIKSNIVISPNGLNPGETQFVQDLQKYLTVKPLENKEIFLLRNRSRGRGVGFFEENSFYPDFILWLKDRHTQKIVFIDPKGLSWFNLQHPKLRLHKHLRREIQPIISQHVKGVMLDAYIISVTPLELAYSALGRKSSEQFAKENHILFMNVTRTRPNPSYIHDLITQIQTS